MALHGASLAHALGNHSLRRHHVYEGSYAIILVAENLLSLGRGCSQLFFSITTYDLSGHGVFLAGEFTMKCLQLLDSIRFFKMLLLLKFYFS